CGSSTFSAPSPRVPRTDATNIPCGTRMRWGRCYRSVRDQTACSCALRELGRVTLETRMAMWVSALRRELAERASAFAVSAGHTCYPSLGATPTMLFPADPA